MAYKQQNVFFTVLEPGKFKIKMLTDPVSGESSSGLQTADFFYCHKIVSREEASSFVTLLRALNAFMRAPSSYPPLISIASQRPYLLVPSHWWVGFQHMKFWGDMFSP